MVKIGYCNFARADYHNIFWTNFQRISTTVVVSVNHILTIKKTFNNNTYVMKN